MALDRNKNYLPGFPESVQELHGSEHCVTVLLDVMREYIQTEWFHINDLPKSISRAFYRRMNKLPETGSFKLPRVSPTREVKRPFSGVGQTVKARKPVSKGKDMNKLRATAGASAEAVRQQPKCTSHEPDKSVMDRLGVLGRTKGLKFHVDLPTSHPLGAIHELIEQSSKLDIDVSATKCPKDIQASVDTDGSKSVDYFIVRNFVSTSQHVYQLKNFACPFTGQYDSNFHDFINDIERLIDKDAYRGLDLIVKREVSNTKYVLDILFVKKGATKFTLTDNIPQYYFSQLSWK